MNSLLNQHMQTVDMLCFPLPTAAELIFCPPAPNPPAPRPILLFHVGLNNTLHFARALSWTVPFIKLEGKYTSHKGERKLPLAHQPFKTSFNHVGVSFFFHIFITLFLLPVCSSFIFFLYPLLLVLAGLFSMFLWATERCEENESSMFIAF